MDLSWLAGIMEGEGSFFLISRKEKSGNSYLCPKVSIEMCDEDVIQTIKEMIGSGTFQVSDRNKKIHKNWSTVYKLSWQGESAIKVMKLILPLMHYRRTEKIKEIIRINTDERKRAKDNFRAVRATYSPRRKAQ